MYAKKAQKVSKTGPNPKLIIRRIDPHLEARRLKILEQNIQQQFQREQQRHQEQSVKETKKELAELKRQNELALIKLQSELALKLEEVKLNTPNYLELKQLREEQKLKDEKTNKLKQKLVNKELEVLEIGAQKMDLETKDLQHQLALVKTAEKTTKDKDELKRLKEKEDEINNLIKQSKEIEKQQEEEVKKLKDSNRNRNYQLLGSLVDSSTQSYKKNLLSYLGLKQDNINKSFDEIISIAKKSSLPNIKTKLQALEQNAEKLKPLGKKQLNNQKTKNTRFDSIVKLGKGDDEVQSPLIHVKGIEGNPNDITTNFQLNELLQPLEKYGFLGVIMADQVSALKNLNPQKRGSFIMNLDPSVDKDGNINEGTHWVAIFWDLRHKHEGDYLIPTKRCCLNQGLFYYDPFGRPPQDAVLEQLKELMDKIMKKFNINYEIFFWYNDIQQQDSKSYECGYFASNWLINMYEGKNIADPIQNMTKEELYDFEKKEIEKNEENIDKFKQEIS